jgi:SAM-dependent methyltransferase
VGIDPAKEYVAYANSRNRFGDRVSFETGDAQQLRFPRASFDASPSLLVYNFIPDPLKALREVRRVTKQGGPISAAVWDYGDGMQMLRVFWDAAVKLDPMAAKLDEKRFELCRKGALGELWKKAGLAEIREQPLEIAMRFESFADYWDAFLLGQGPAGAYVRSLKRDPADRLRQELRSRLPASGAFTLSGRAWAVRGLA